MNPAKHVKNLKTSQYIGTFISDSKDGKPYFGWSKYNSIREKADGVPFNKKVGRTFAHESAEKEITIDTEKGYLHKGDLKVRNPEMVVAAMEFVARMNKYYKKAPVNVKIVIGINYLKRIAKKVMDKNEELKEEIHKVRHSNLQLSIENDGLRSRIKRIAQECTG